MKSPRIRLMSIVAIVVLSMHLNGCSSTLSKLTTYHNTDIVAANKDEVISVDAKQRFMVSGVRDNTREAIAAGFPRSIAVFCTEPSPDALAALAATMGMNLSIPNQAAVGVSGTMAESAANIGLRTAAIQSLRDITYRDCEGYANKGISAVGFETLQRRFQSTMVAILAIEQLTGANTPAAIGLSTEAQFDTASLAKLTEDTNKDLAALNAAKADQKSADAAYQQAVADKAANVAEKLSALDAAKAATAEKQKMYENDQASLVAAVAANGASKAHVVKLQDGASGGSNTAAVAQAVTDIVTNTLQLGFGREVCTSLIGRDAEAVHPAVPEPGTAFYGCLELLKGDKDFYEQNAKAVAANAELTQAQANLINKINPEHYSAGDLSAVIAAIHGTCVGSCAESKPAGKPTKQEAAAQTPQAPLKATVPSTLHFPEVFEFKDKEKKTPAQLGPAPPSN